MEFTAFIDESVEKIISFQQTQGSYLKLSVLALGEYHPKFSRKQLRSVLHFKYVIYVQRNTRSYFIGKFWRKLHYQFYLAKN